MKALFKQLFFLVTPKPRLPADRAVILMYHSISDRPDYFSSVSPVNFERQMRYLADKKYPVISLGEVLRRIKSGESLGGSVAITFDDGYRDNLVVAFPILKKYNFPATIFVTTGLAGTNDKRGLKRMTVEELRMLEGSGLVAIEPHTTTHPRLSRLSAEAAREEIEGSKQFLEAALGKRCRFFATPYGDFNDETLQAIHDCGFEAATTVAEGTTMGRGADLFRLPRVSIDRSTTFAQFKGKLSTAVDWYEKLKL